MGGKKVRLESNPIPPSTKTPQKFPKRRNNQAPRNPVNQVATISPKLNGSRSMLMEPVRAASSQRSRRSMT